jgi:hypothetical protein
MLWWNNINITSAFAAFVAHLILLLFSDALWKYLETSFEKKALCKINDTKSCGDADDIGVYICKGCI